MMMMAVMFIMMIIIDVRGAVGTSISSFKWTGNEKGKLPQGDALCFLNILIPFIIIYGTLHLRIIVAIQSSN